MDKEIEKKVQLCSDYAIAAKVPLVKFTLWQKTDRQTLVKVTHRF